MRNLVSIIIPVYNVGPVLLTCVESILQSTYRNYEIIIVDDGSKIDTAELCDYIQTLDHRIIVFHIENSGVSVARNWGIENSSGNYIMFVDADDTINNNAIEILYQLCIDYSADFSICGYTECYEDGSSKAFHDSKKMKVWSKDELCHEFFVGDSIGWNVWAKMYRRNTIDNVRFPVSMRVAEDMYFIYQVCMKSQKAVQKEITIYNYMKHENSTMAALDCAKFFDNYALLNQVLCDDSYILSEKLAHDKKQFFIRHTLWFLRFIIGKDRKNMYDCIIKQIREELLVCVKKYDCKKLKIQQRIEIAFLKYAYPIFKRYTLIKNKRN